MHANGLRHYSSTCSIQNTCIWSKDWCIIDLSMRPYWKTLPMLLFFIFQVNDFLAGKSPLTLAMRLGDHMMFVQLQLSTSQSSSKRTTSSSSSSKHRSAKHAGGISSSSASSTSSQSRHQANAPHLQQQQKQQTVPSYVSPPQVSPSNSISSPSPLGTGSKVVVPVPVHAQPRSTSHPYAACHPNNSNPLPAAAGAAPQIASGLNAPKPATGVIAPKPTKVDGAPVLDSTALAEASRNLSQKLKELSAASSTHIKTPIDVKQKKVTHIPSIFLWSDIGKLNGEMKFKFIFGRKDIACLYELFHKRQKCNKLGNKAFIDAIFRTDIPHKKNYVYFPLLIWRITSNKGTRLAPLINPWSSYLILKVATQS